MSKNVVFMHKIFSKYLINLIYITVLHVYKLMIYYYVRYNTILYYINIFFLNDNHVCYLFISSWQVRWLYKLSNRKMFMNLYNEILKKEHFLKWKDTEYFFNISHGTYFGLTYNIIN